MKAHYLRNWESETYLVPEEAVKKFDKLTQKIDSVPASDKKDLLYDDFNLKYGDYKQEGDLYDKKLFIEEPIDTTPPQQEFA